MTTRRFHLGDVLSVTAKVMLSPRGMDGLAGILKWMTGGDELSTNQLPRAGDECMGPLLAQHPALAGIKVPDDFGPREGADQRLAAWLAEQAAVHGEYLDVAPLAEGEHTRMSSIAEFRRDRPDAVVVPPVDFWEEGVIDQMIRALTGAGWGEADTTPEYLEFIESMEG